MIRTSGTGASSPASPASSVLGATTVPSRTALRTVDLHGARCAALAGPPRLRSEQAIWICKSLTPGLTWLLGNLPGQPKPYFTVPAVIMVMQGQTYGSLPTASAKRRSCARPVRSGGR